MPHTRSLSTRVSIAGRAMAGALIFMTSIIGPLRATEAQPASESVAHSEAIEWLDPEPVAGTIVLVGSGNVPASVPLIYGSRLGNDASILVIGLAAEDATRAADDAAEWLREAGFSEIRAIPKGDEAVASDLLASAIGSARGVWLCDGNPSRLAAALASSEVTGALRELLARGGVIGGASAGAAILGHGRIGTANNNSTVIPSLGLVPDAIIDTRADERRRSDPARVLVDQSPGLFGIGIDEQAVVLIEGRLMRVIGEGKAALMLGASPLREAEQWQLGSSGIADLTQIRRAARSRQSGQDPGLPRFGKPRVDSGSLVIVGGGGMPKEIVDRFIELAGGRDAHIVVMPTAVPRALVSLERVPGFLVNAPVASVTMLPQCRLNEIESEEFVQAMQRATGVWFGGGRQWNFVDAYEGTRAIELFHGVLERGGVIGGSSAGATIQGEFLVRGHPLGNTVMMAEGYERGFAFLPGVAIDQHFSQRRRLPDLIPVIERHPKMLGIGIDEATALVVRKSKAEVIGAHAVHFLSADRLRAAEAESLSESEIEALYRSVRSGDSIDLASYDE